MLLKMSFLNAVQHNFTVILKYLPSGITRELTHYLGANLLTLGMQGDAVLAATLTILSTICEC